ncbi:MAG TPA: EamA family transporter [Thermoanaerobaculia bacterium]|nr:EamA family transporter [Thermoanaerobaculia bacterium]
MPGAATRSKVLPWVAYAVCAVVWGSTYFAIAVALESFPPYGMVAVRFGVASVLTLAIGRLFREPWPSRKELPHLALVGVLLLGICNALIVWSETRVSSGVAAVLAALTPAWFGLLTARTEPLGGRGWIGTGLGLAGVVLLVGPGTSGGVDLGGVAAILLATVLWAVGTLHHRRHVHGGGALTNAGLEMLAAALLGALLAPFGGGFVRETVTPKALLAIGYLAVFGSCIAYTAHLYLSKAWSPARAGTYAYLNPVIAVLLGAAFLGEAFNARMGLGMAVVLAGVALVQYRSRGG